MFRFAPCRVESWCKSVETHHEAFSEVKPGDNVGFNVRNVTVKDIRRGYVASDGKNKPTTGCENVMAQVIIMAHPGQISKGYTAVMTATRRTIRARWKATVEVRPADGPGARG